MKFNPPIIKSFNKAPSVKSFMMLISMITLSLIHNELYAQTVSVDISNTPTQLVDMLMDGSCAVRSNQTISSPQSVGYFTNNNSNFPIQEGIIIRSGKALLTQGSYTGQDLSSQVNTNSDADLQALSNSSGQISTISDVAFLEFDFVPNGSHFSFNFLFASNEYGEWQCGFSDVFAFLLTNVSTGETTNLAVVPGTNTPISVKDIRNNSFNSSCNSINENLFSTYNVNNPQSVINMRGYTVVMNASASVIPGTTYRIKLAIGDYNDADFDSAVFIESGTFNSSIDLGEDRTICNNEEVTLDSQISDTINYSFQWRRDSAIIQGENNPTLTTNIPGSYDLIVTTDTGCILKDHVFINNLQTSDPVNILQCDAGSNTFFDLTLNDASALGIDPNVYEVLYYESMADATSDNPIDQSTWSNYQSQGNQTIFTKIRNNITNIVCSDIKSFHLLALNLSASDPNDFSVCVGQELVNIVDQVELQILNGLTPTEHRVDYFLSEDDALNNVDPITDPTIFGIPVNDTTIWARLSSNANSNCFDVVDFNISISQIPPVDTLPDVTECAIYSLPPLTNGNYYTMPNGEGMMLNAGDDISTTTTLYIYNENADNCSNESEFNVQIARSLIMASDYCEQFSVPPLAIGQFFTQPNGPNGTGEEVPPGTLFESDTSIYFYVSLDNVNVCIDRRYDIKIHPMPAVDDLEDVVTCTTFTLPALTNGNYFTESGGNGQLLNAGDIIDTTSTIFIFNLNAVCEIETSFNVTIIDTSVFTDIDSCGDYTIPVPPFGIGNFFTQSNGNGSILEPDTVISADQTIYYYADTMDSPNCTSNIPIAITIHPVPQVSELDDVVTCMDTPYELPSIPFGRYYTESNGQGTALNPGDIISGSQEIYIYNSNSFCSSETSFTVEVRPLPEIDNFTDIFICEPYVLPNLTNGNYYTEPNGQGTQLNAGDLIATTQTVYIYDAYTDLMGCSSENVFTINILGVSVDPLEDVAACDTYTLQPLTVGDYYTQPNGQGTQLFPGDIITATQTIYIYAEQGDRFVCFDNHEFTITIGTTPSSYIFENKESCGSYTLEVPSIPNVSVSFYREPNGVNLIDPSDYTLTEPGIYTIHARLADQNSPGCFVDAVFGVTVHPLQELQIAPAIICVDADSGFTTQSAMLTSGLDPTIFEVNWYLNGTLVGSGTNYEAIEAGIYTVETTKLIPDVGNDCNYAPTQVEVKASSPKAKITFLTEPFDVQTNVQVDFIESGLGSYEYQLDNGPFQASNIFLNVPIGEHVITIRDTTNLCGHIELPFTAMSHPVFFTPNGDGINDTWNIPDLRDHTEATIKIFDRYGRFVKEIKPSGEGWNGFSNNGTALPPNSYWFTVEFMFEGVQKTFTSYFALERK